MKTTGITEHQRWEAHVGDPKRLEGRKKTKSGNILYYCEIAFQSVYAHRTLNGTFLVPFVEPRTQHLRQQEAFCARYAPLNGELNLGILLRDARAFADEMTRQYGRPENFGSIMLVNHGFSGTNPLEVEGCVVQSEMLSRELPSPEQLIMRGNLATFVLDQTAKFEFVIASPMDWCGHIEIPGQNYMDVILDPAELFDPEFRFSAKYVKQHSRFFRSYALGEPPRPWQKGDAYVK